MDKLFPTRYSQTTQVKAFAGTGGATAPKESRGGFVIATRKEGR